MRAIPRAVACVAVLVATAGQVQAGIIFADDFSSNTGWTLTNTWQIGPAMASPFVYPGILGNPDPASDHSPTADNGVLGAAIGGNIGRPDGLHDFWWATSPVIDATSQSAVTLEFYRWLNSDIDPFMTSRIEGWDGTGWQVIWDNRGFGSSSYVTDGSWVFQSYDVSALADNNSQFQVRFGYDVTDSGVWTMSGWNIDDIQVLSAVSPVPEPSSLALFGIGACVAGLGARTSPPA